LVELLAVVAIIGILGALACLWIPAAMEKSRASRCVNNLRQIGMAYSLYAADHKGNVAEGWYNGQSPDSRPAYLFQALAPYLSGGRLTESALAIPDNSLPVSWCPTFLNQYSPANVGNAASTSYAGNRYFSLGLLGRTANRKFNQLDRPDKTVLLMDSMGTLSSGKYIGAAFKQGVGYGEIGGIPDCHSHGANVLYADFHVLWLANGSPEEPQYLYDATRPY
jgi:prepilin-type processing-associated H-X9-DG protein